MEYDFGKETDWKKEGKLGKGGWEEKKVGRMGRHEETKYTDSGMRALYVHNLLVIPLNRVYIRSIITKSFISAFPFFLRKTMQFFPGTHTSCRA